MPLAATVVLHTVITVYRVAFGQLRRPSTVPSASTIFLPSSKIPSLVQESEALLADTLVNTPPELLSSALIALSTTAPTLLRESLVRLR
jgi:hypothetical protein